MRRQREGQHSAAGEWQSKVSAALLGTVGGGLTINVISNDYRWHAVAAVMAIGTVWTVSTWLRIRPGALIVSWISRLLLSIALAAALFSTLAPSIFSPWPIVLAVALAASALLIPANLSTATTLLARIVTVGTVVTALGYGATALLARNFSIASLMLFLCIFNALYIAMTWRFSDIRQVQGQADYAAIPRHSPDMIKRLGGYDTRLEVQTAALGVLSIVLGILMLTSKYTLVGFLFLGVGLLIITSSIVIFTMYGQLDRVRTWWMKVSTSQSAIQDAGSNRVP